MPSAACVEVRPIQARVPSERCGVGYTTTMAGSWRKHQAKDPYFRRARAEGYRARSAYKLLELQEHFKLLRPGHAVVDLGAAPGSWSQVAARLVGPAGVVVAVDLAEMAPLPGVTTLQADICAPETAARVRELLGRDADVVLSDAAPATTGIKIADHARSVELAECSLALALGMLRPGGSFVAKVFRGSDFDQFVATARRSFCTVKVRVPPATRQESAEAYVVGLDLRADQRA